MKICDQLKCLNRHRSKSIKVTSLFFCQNDVLIGGSFWQKDSLVTLILFDLCLFKHFSLLQIFVISLYVKVLSILGHGTTKLFLGQVFLRPRGCWGIQSGPRFYPNNTIYPEHSNANSSSQYLGPPRVLCQVSFGFWVTCSNSSWQKY